MNPLRPILSKIFSNFHPRPKILTTWGYRATIYRDILTCCYHLVRRKLALDVEY